MYAILLQIDRLSIYSSPCLRGGLGADLLGTQFHDQQGLELPYPRYTLIHAQSRRSYGRERIVRQLHAQGFSPGHERVRKSLLRQKLSPVYRRPYRVTIDSKHDEPIAANILSRRFEGWRINRAWVGDITFIATAEGWLYLAVIMDLGLRRLGGQN